MTKSWPIFLIFITVLAASAFIALKPTSPIHNNPNSINAFMTDVRHIDFNTDGKINTLLYTPKMTHSPQHDVSLLIKPSILTYASDRTPWMTQSEFGKSLDDDRLELWGDVHFHQLPHNKHIDTKISTEAMTLYPSRSYAETAKPVTLIRPGSLMHSVGLQAYLNRGVYKLLSNSSGDFDLRKDPKIKKS